MGMRPLLLPLLLCCALAAASERNAIDYARFIDSLRAARMSVKTEGSVEQPFFSVKGKLISLQGEHLQVFEYRNDTLAEKDAALVSADGRTIGTTKPHWLGPPHFFRKGRLIALYLGDDGKILKALEARLGPQFAGD